MGIFRHNKILKILACLSAMAVALLVAATLLPGSADATDSVENTYAIMINSASQGGEYVSHLALRYLDNDGREHKAYVQPNNGGLLESLKCAKSADPTRISIFEKMGIAGEGTMSALTMPLQKGKTDTYFFIPETQVKEVLGLEILFETDQQTTWTIDSLRIYKVDRIRELKMNGYVSDEYTVRFDGELIAMLQEKEAVFQLNGSTAYMLSEEDSAEIALNFDVHEELIMNSSDEYTVIVEFADRYGAGFERLTQSYEEKNSLYDLPFGEMMVALIDYIDIYGANRIISVPVITSSVATMVEKGFSPDSMISGIAQQGERIAFNCFIPQMQSIRSVTLSQGLSGQGMTTIPMYASEDSCISEISIYPAENVTLDFDGDKTSADAPSWHMIGKPIGSFKDALGIDLAADQLYMFDIDEDRDGVLELSPTVDRYLLEFKSDSKYIMSLPQDLYVQIEYMNLLGEEIVTDELSVKELLRDFYGYWPASTDDFAYTSLLCSDSGVRMVVQMQDVDYFTGITFCSESAYSDLEIKNVALSLIHTMPIRYSTWTEMVGSTSVSNRMFDRNVGAYSIFRMEQSFIVSKNEPYVLDFVSRRVPEIPAEQWTEDALSIDESSTNLGFANEREHYSVKVHVHGSSMGNDIYGDSGSKNRFYFALEFENGKSGYILANRQLGSDGFRAGFSETLSIYTNRDYGELLAVRIIPDDLSTDSIPSDKLNIDEIRVCKDSGNAINKEWVIETVGWVGMDHHDEDSAAVTGRTESELARRYPVSGYANALNLEFYLSTGVNPEGKNAPAFQGSIFANLEYLDSNGDRQIEEFDLIQELYRYSNLPEQYARNNDLWETPKIISDPSTMFRENHTDRFMLTLSDVAKLNKLTLHITSQNDCRLDLSDVSVGVVTSPGLLLRNENDEFYRNHRAEYLCDDTSRTVPAYALDLTKDQEVVQEIRFSDHNEIKLDRVEHTWLAAIASEPESKYDEFNIFVYPSDDSRGQFGLDAEVCYTDYLGRVLKNEASDLSRTVDSDGNVMYYVHGIGAFGSINLNSLSLVAQTGEEAVNAYVDHAIVQQIRNGTVIASYYFDCDHANVEQKCLVSPIADTSSKLNEQTVMLMLGEKTNLADLIAQDRDLAIAIRYTIANDGGDREYYSEYVYLTEQGYQQIAPGKLLTLTFRESFVKEITGISLKTSGGLTLRAEMACAANYNISSSTGIKEQIGWYSFANGLNVSSQNVILERTFNQDVQPLRISFITAEPSLTVESGTDDPIEMKLGYADSKNAAKEIVIKDIRNYVISEGEPFSTGSITEIELLIKDPEELRWIKLNPYDKDTSYVTGWYLSELHMELGTNGRIQRASRKVDHYIQEGNSEDFKINLINITISLDVRALNEYGGYGVSRQVSSASNNNVSIVGISGSKVMFENIKLTNTTQGFTYLVERVIDDENAAQISNIMNAGGSYGTLNIPDNYTGNQIVYRVTIYSKESTSTKVLIYVLVDPVEKEPEPTEDDFDLSDVIIDENEYDEAGNEYDEWEDDFDGTEDDADASDELIPLENPQMP